MTPQEFHERVLAEKGDMSWAEFAREFEELSDKQLQYLLNARRKMGLPSISTLIAIDVLFTVDEMRDLIEQKLDDDRMRDTSRLQGEKYLAALLKTRPQTPERKQKQHIAKMYWLVRAVGV